MDDPWANAWGEPTKSDARLPSTWVPPTTNDALDSEIDIAVPSWATGTGVKWAEPSDTQDSLWGATLPSKEWAVSPYDSIYLGKGSVDELSRPSDSPSSEPIEPPPPEPLTPAPPSEIPGTDELEVDTVTSRPSSPATLSPKSTPPPNSPDAFGTFETGLIDDELGADSWSYSAVIPDPSPLEANAWGGSGWGATSSVADVSLISEPVDEWENAKQQKEKQDLHVPPQVLASILHQFEELSRELWPNVTDVSDRGVDNKSQSLQDGTEGDIGFTHTVRRLLPQDLTLPSHVQFSKTFTSKHMGESLRYTRHVGTTRSSPMALYLASKGSTAWETSVKSRPENLKDDLLPPGWRVIEKEMDAPSPATDTKKKASGGLLSFFGRRGGPASPATVSSSRPASPVRPPSAASVVAPSLSASPSRVSADSNSSPQVQPSTPVASFSTAALMSSLESIPAVPITSSTPSTLTSSPQQFVPETTSAVSRFLTRFSRNKTTGSSPRNSLALSTDDLEFLSDIIPSADDEVDEASQLRNLSSMVDSSPLPTKLPPPLPPPPRLLPLAQSSRNITNGQNARHPSGINDDLFSPFVSSTANTPIASAHSGTSPPPKLFTNPLRARPLSPSTPVTETSPSTMNQFSSAFDLPPTSTSLSATHIPLHPKRPPVATTLRAAMPMIPLNSSFAIFPPPPSSRVPPPNLLLDIGATVARNSTQVLVPLQEFQRTTPMIATTSLDSNISSVFSNKSLISSSSTSTSDKDLIDDFDDFVSSPLRTPSPPLPPEKIALFGHKSAPPRSTSSTNSQPRPPRRASRAADHQRTMSLLDIAATRQGRWPAPPSPLPHILPPPPSNTLPDFSGSNIGPSISSPAAFPDSDDTPWPPNHPPLLGFATPPPQPKAHSPLVTPQQHANSKPNLTNPLPTPSMAVQPGGLSAQDLSFFESL